MRRPLITCAMVLSAVAGCAPAPQAAPPRTTAERFHAEVASGQGRRACELLAPGARERLAKDDGGCARAVLELGLRGGPVREVAVWGDEAQVRMAGDTVFLHRYARGWLIRGAGCEPDPPRPYDCDVEA